MSDRSTSNSSNNGIDITREESKGKGKELVRRRSQPDFAAGKSNWGPLRNDHSRSQETASMSSTDNTISSLSPSAVESVTFDQRMESLASSTHHLRTIIQEKLEHYTEEDAESLRDFFDKN